MSDSSSGASMPGGAVQIEPRGAFYYSSLQTMLVYWQVEPAVAATLLPKGLEPAIFDGLSLVNLNFERYATVGGSFDGIVNEVEINVVAYPTRMADATYRLTTLQFFQGDDQAKLYGNYRVIVPCDSQDAISGGEKYGENKYAATFSDPSTGGGTYKVPGINSPGITSWTIPCWSPQSDLLFTLSVPSLPGAPTVQPLSPVPDWATLAGSDGTTFLIQSARNILGTFDTWLNVVDGAPAPFPSGTATVTIGSVPGNPVVEALTTMFAGDPQVIAICEYDSPPAAVSTHTQLMEPIS